MNKSLFWMIVLLGAAAGLRATAPMGAATLATNGSSSGLVPSRLKRGFMGAMCLEFLMDKLPFAPNRTSLLALLPRIVSGSVAGAWLAKSRQSNLKQGAVIGGIAAIIAAYVGLSLRKGTKKLTHLPDVIIAMGEDALASKMALSAYNS